MPFGRFKYLRAPYGLSSIVKLYDHWMVDDIVIYDKDKASHIAHIQQFLQHCQDRQISLNRDKCNFCQTEVTFAGFWLSLTGYRIDSLITKAVSTPTNSTDLRLHFLGWLTSCLQAWMQYQNSCFQCTHIAKLQAWLFVDIRTQPSLHRSKGKVGRGAHLGIL